MCRETARGGSPPPRGVACHYLATREPSLGTLASSPVGWDAPGAEDAAQVLPDHLERFLGVDPLGEGVEVDVGEVVLGAVLGGRREMGKCCGRQDQGMDWN